MTIRLLKASAIAVSLTFSIVSAQASEDMAFEWRFCNLGTKDFAQAISACTKIIEKGGAKDRHLAYNQRGRAFLVRGWPENALADFNQVVNLVPKWPDGYNNRAVAYRQLGRFPEALADHDRAIAMEKKPLFIQARENTVKKMGHTQ